jgi:hypothetical protein
VEAKARGTAASMDGVFQSLWTDAQEAWSRGIEHDKFLDDFLAQRSAERILHQLDLPATASLTSVVTAAVKAEAAYRKLPIVDVARFITDAALEDRRRGIPVDRFYFENVKWRSNVKVSKAEQRKLDNLEVNARVKQRFRERYGNS